MLRLTEIKLPLDHAEGAVQAAILKRLEIDSDELAGFTVFRRAHDARKRSAIFLIYTVDVEVRDEVALLEHLAGKAHIAKTPDMEYKFVARAPANLALRPVVIGTGPCGYFAGLILAQMGFRPILLERGKAVRERTQDTWGLWRKRVLNPESNVQFGEGGAGTFSDGKLYSQIKDRKFYGRKVLTEFVAAGAPEEILYVSKPHIGTFRLVGMVEKLRAQIESLGGEVRFGSKVVDIEIAHFHCDRLDWCRGLDPLCALVHRVPDFHGVLQFSTTSGRLLAHGRAKRPPIMACRSMRPALQGADLNCDGRRIRSKSTGSGTWRIDVRQRSQRSRSGLRQGRTHWHCSRSWMLNAPSA